jgi:hypothetical protein
MFEVLWVNLDCVFKVSRVKYMACTKSDFYVSFTKSHLKEEALDRTMWRARFGRDFGPVVRQTTK